MTKQTHTQGGLLLGLMVATLLLMTSLSQKNIIYSIMLLCIYMYAVYFGSLLPDIDKKGSYISKTMPLIYNIFGKKQKHRHFTHSILAIVIMSLGSEVLIYASNGDAVISMFSLGLIVGCISHIMLDLLTIDGVKLLYPLKEDISFYNIKTSTYREKKVRKFLEKAVWIILGFNIHIVLIRLMMYK